MKETIRERAVPILPGDNLAVASGRTFGFQDPFGNSLFIIGPVAPERS